MRASSDSERSRRVLIVEDEAPIRRGLSDVLRFRGCYVEVAIDGAEGLRLGSQPGWDLIVLDVMLPELDGFVVCERIRATDWQTPILMLTAKGDEDDIVRGFEVGANDYVTKPFSVRELIARVEALLRRSAAEAVASFHVGELEIDGARGCAACGDERIELTAREVQILRILSRDAGRIVGRRTLLSEAWGMSNVGALETRTVDVHIAKLRKKLGAHGHLIGTVRGQGYRLCLP